MGCLKAVPADPTWEEEMVRRPKRDVLRYIAETIEYERGNNTAAPPGGYARGLARAEADLVYVSVRKTMETVGLPVRPEWHPPNAYQAGRLDDAYRGRGLDPTPLRIH
jgi:hypothetical protein